MRAAFYYEDWRRVGRNDGPPLYWKRCGEELLGRENAVHLIPDGNWADHGKFDVNFWVDWGDDALMPNLPYKPVTPPNPNVYVTSDTHLGYDYRLSMARQFDLVFCNQKRAVEEFIRDGINPDRVFWLPHAVEPLAYPTKEIIKKYDVAFIGNIGSWGRVDFLDRMFREFPNFFYGKRLFEEAADVFCSSRIVLNISIGDDVNMRVFEALATKSLLLTNELPTLPDLFRDGVHLVTYKTHDEAVEKAKYYLAHENEANAIAERGYSEVMGKHTYMHRLKMVLDILKQKGALL
jgi:hypothetical protein